MLNVLSPEERERQEVSEEIASKLRDLTGKFMVDAAKSGIDVNYLKLEWNYDDGTHIICGGA